MKKTIICITMSTMLFLFSCQKENPQNEDTAVSLTEKQNWLSANLDSEFASSQKQVTAYLFSTEEMSALIKTPNIKNVHFVLGYSDNTIQINVVGVDKSGKELGVVNSTILKESNFAEKLVALKESSIISNATAKRTALQNKHILLPKIAFEGIEAWKEKLNTVSDLDEITSYEGTRFNYFRLEYEIIEAMVNQSSANIGLFLGLNQDGKLCTILIGLDANNAIKKPSANSKSVNELYDFAEPNPPGTPDDD